MPLDDVDDGDDDDDNKNKFVADCDETGFLFVCCGMDDETADGIDFFEAVDKYDGDGGDGSWYLISCAIVSVSPNSVDPSKSVTMGRRYESRAMCNELVPTSTLRHTSVWRISRIISLWIVIWNFNFPLCNLSFDLSFLLLLSSSAIALIRCVDLFRFCPAFLFFIFCAPCVEIRRSLFDSSIVVMF